MPNFYDQITPFRDFENIQDLQHFKQAPGDWAIVITDIKGSTEAAAKGRGKDVNMLGAAVITLLSNSLRSLRIPFVFGGDGATLLMPKSLFLEMRSSFVGLMRLAKDKFNLELRVGAVDVLELEKSGHSVLVGKYETSPHSHFAQFLGSGFAEAERWVKSGAPQATVLNDSEKAEKPNLDGLSCRLMPIASKNGVIASIIVRSRANDNSAWVRGPLLNELKKILNNDLMSANPVSEQGLAWPLIPQTLRAEVALHPRGFVQILGLLARILMANVMLKFNLNGGGFISARYKTEVPTQSDFKKFDDNLRMVIDCNEAQFRAIEKLLAQGKDEGRILYGLNKTKSAVVTCITHTASKGEHIHFVDGENCGYTQAALQIKKDLLTSSIHG